MKKIKFIFFATIFFVCSCKEENHSNSKLDALSDWVIVHKMHDSESLTYKSYLKTIIVHDNQGSRLDHTAQLTFYELASVESTETLITAINEEDEYAISFIESITGEITDVILSTTVITENGILSELYNSEGVLQLSYHDSFNGKREITHSNYSNKNGRIESTWSECFDYCMGKLNSPFDSNTANVIFGIAANATTGLLYTASTFVVCSAAAGSMKKCSDDKTN